MTEVDPFSLPSLLFEEVYLPDKHCWKHHYSVLTEKKAKELTELLAQAGIVISSARYTEEEDAILRRNFESLKSDLGFVEGDDPRKFAGFGKRENKSEIMRYEDRARAADFNKRMGNGLENRLCKSYRRRFISIFDPKLTKNEFIRVVSERRLSYILDKDGEKLELSEEELREVYNALKKSSTNLEALEKIEGRMKDWPTKLIFGKMHVLTSLKKGELPLDKWSYSFKSMVSRLRKKEGIDDEEVIKIIEDENYDWKGKVGFLSLCMYTHLTEKSTAKAWKEILVAARKVLRKLRKRESPFILDQIIEKSEDLNGFRKWKEVYESWYGMKLEKKEAKKMFELVLKQYDYHVASVRRHLDRFRVIRFKNGEIVPFLIKSDLVFDTDRLMNIHLWKMPGMKSDEENMKEEEERKLIENVKMEEEEDDDAELLKDPEFLLVKKDEIDCEDYEEKKSRKRRKKDSEMENDEGNSFSSVHKKQRAREEKIVKNEGEVGPSDAAIPDMDEFVDSGLDQSHQSNGIEMEEKEDNDEEEEARKEKKSRKKKKKKNKELMEENVTGDMEDE